MGNYSCCMAVATNSKKGTIDLIRSDGTVQVFHKPLSAGQIMQEFPEHLVCHSDSFYIGQRTAALSENDELKVGNKYFLLPEHFFQSGLTLLSIASLISPPYSPTPTTGVSAGPLRSIERVSALCQPFELQSSEMGGGRGIKVSAEFVRKLIEDRRLNIDELGHAAGTDSAEGKQGLCNTPELQKDYEQLVTSRGKCWTPKLETIKEKEKKGNLRRLCSKLKDYVRLNRS